MHDAKPIIKKAGHGRPPRFPGIVEDASTLGVTRQHLWSVLSGRLISRTLSSRYLALKAAQEGAQDGAHNTVAAGRDAGQRKFHEDQKAVFRQKCAADFAALQNHSEEYQSILEKLGLQLLVVRFEGDAGSPVWTHPDVGENIGAELDASGAGSFDSSHMAFGSLFCNFHVAHLAKALGVLKRALESRGLLGCSTILHAETEAGWRVYFPPTASLLDPSDSGS
jgi:hypothetical protein